MSDTDSFIDEVTEEVRRDKLFALMRRYGWLAVLAILAVVGGAAYNELGKSRAKAAAQALGDDIVAALGQNDAEGRAAQLSAVTANSDGGNAVLDFILAAERAEAGQTDAAILALDGIATNGDLPEIYRQIAAFKALTLQTTTLPASERRARFESLAQPGAPLRLLAEEQLALIDIEDNQTEAAIARLQAILQDAEAAADLQQRAAQVIVSLGGTPVPPAGPQG